MRAIRALAAMVVGASAGLAAVNAAAPAASADPGSCTPSRGVVVVVDFGPFGGSVQRGCDPSPSTGYNALYAAGFTTTGTSHDGPGFVCRIDQLPGPGAEKCVLTPKATAYWSYWHADAGESAWSYSVLGVLTYRPPTGSVDAWAFGAGSPPRVTPAAVRATAPAPVPTAPRATAPPSGPVAPPGGPLATSGATPTPSRSPNRGATSPARSTTSPENTAPASTAPASTAPASTAPDAANPSPAVGASPGPTVVDVDGAAKAAGGSSSSLLPVLIGVGAAVLLGGVAGATAWRRRGAG